MARSLTSESFTLASSALLVRLLWQAMEDDSDAMPVMGAFCTPTLASKAAVTSHGYAGSLLQICDPERPCVVRCTDDCRERILYTSDQP